MTCCTDEIMVTMLVYSHGENSETVSMMSSKVCAVCFARSFSACSENACKCLASLPFHGSTRLHRKLATVVGVVCACYSVRCQIAPYSQMCHLVCLLAYRTA